MSLLAVSILAAVLGVAVVAFIVVRFAMKVMWKLAMIAVMLVILALGAAAAYVYFVGSPVALPELPSTYLR